MSKKVYVLSVQPEVDGPVFGRVMDPTAIQSLQDYAHGHISQVVKDLLVAGAPGAQVAGFAATVAGGLNVSVAPGNVVDSNGLSYESSGDPTVVTVGAAHPTLPRIDLIIATLEIDAPAESELVAFRQLRTQIELEAGADPYVPTQFNQPQELHTRATISVRAGVAGAIPVAPVAGAGEVALWRVAVAAADTVLANGDLTDVRVLMKSLYQLQQLVTQAGLAEIVQDIVGGFVAASTSIVPTYDDNGNVETLALHSTYKAQLDEATANNVASTLVKRDGSGNARFNETKVDTAVRFMGDNSLKRSSFIREHRITVLDLDTPLSFQGAATGVYETVKRDTVASHASGGVPSVNVSPEVEFYLDPADFQGMSVKLEVFALHAGNVWETEIQLYNATDSAELAKVTVTWLHVAGGPYRSTLVSLSGSGAKRIVLRARHLTDQANAELKLWRVHLIINPSF